MATKAKSNSLADILFPEALEQQSFADGVLSIPPEQRKLHTETYDFTVETMTEKLVNGSVFIPEYQRRYVWSEPQASRLIESLIIQCPIPVVYLNQEADEKLAVIDGNQRLTSIKRYLNNEFPLKGLTAYPELEGSRFHELDPRIQRHIINRTLRCIVILKDTHPQVKFDVFERLNTGAVKLTPQELRHGLYFGDTTNLATEIAKKNNFASVIDIKSDKRMKAEELILRFWAFTENFDSYKKPLSGFINSFTDENRSLDNDKKNKLKLTFEQGLTGVLDYFGEYAFKIFDKNMKIESSFNSALFDAEMIAVHQLRKENKLKDISQKEALSRLATLFLNDESFRRSISIATSDENQVRLRVSKIKNMLTQ